MRKNTLTTIGDLRPGDVFRVVKGFTWLRFVKLQDETVRKNKELFHCQALPVDGVTPKPFKKNTTVVYLYKQKQTQAI